MPIKDLKAEAVHPRKNKYRKLDPHQDGVQSLMEKI